MPRVGFNSSQAGVSVVHAQRNTFGASGSVYVVYQSTGNVPYIPGQLGSRRVLQEAWSLEDASSLLSCVAGCWALSHECCTQRLFGNISQPCSLKVKPPPRADLWPMPAWWGENTNTRSLDFHLGKLQGVVLALSCVPFSFCPFAQPHLLFFLAFTNKPVHTQEP